MRSIVTPDDLKKTDPIDPGWYPAEIVNYSEEVTKDNVAKGKKSDGSLNCIFEMKLVDGPPNAKGRTFKRYFNEKALYFGKNLWATIVPGFDRVKGGELNSDVFRSTIGKKLMVYVEKDKNTGYDSISDYRPMA